jgi:surface polysaccharide O-acyltransferase-like enzyme
VHSESSASRTAIAPAALPLSGTSKEYVKLLGRNHSIDAFRVVANFGIICVHTAPFMAATFDPHARLVGEWLTQVFRVATPFFFLAAGYFFGSSLSRGALPLPLAAKLVKRLMIFFLFWSAVYVVVPIEYMLRAPGLDYFSAVRLMLSQSLSLHVVMNGTKVHLWFLPALSCSLALLGVAVHLKWERALIPVGVLLYGFGLLAGAYQHAPLGWDLGLNTRNGPFFGTLFVVSGFFLHRLGWQCTSRQALGLIGLGILCRVAELGWLSACCGTSPSNVDYLIGTYPFGLGIFMLLLTTRWLGENAWMVKLSRYSAGVYCAHALSIEILKDRPPVWNDPLWEVTRPFVALAMTFALVILLSKIRILRPVVS